MEGCLEMVRRGKKRAFLCGWRWLLVIILVKSGLVVLI
jgi:hypothetical protein